MIKLGSFKKIAFVLGGVLLGVMGASAQTKEDISASERRAEKLAKLVEKEPKPCGLEKVDRFAQNVFKVAKASVVNSELLSSLYYRSIGETKDGVTDVAIKKPTKEELLALSATIAEQAVALDAAQKDLQAAQEEVKSERNPLKAAKVAKVLKTAVDALPILGEETLAQGKAIKQMIETASTAGNL